MSRLKQYIPGGVISSVEELCMVCRLIRESNEWDKEGLVKLANTYYLSGPRPKNTDYKDLIKKDHPHSR